MLDELVPSNPAPNAETDAGFAPREAFGSVWRRKRYPIGFLVLFLLLGGIYLLVAPRKYAVTARLLVQRQNMPTDAEREPSTSGSFLATQAEIIHSPAVIEQAVAKLDLPPRENYDPLLEIPKYLTVRPTGGTNVLSIKYVAADDDLAVRTVQAIIDSYREYLRANEEGSQIEVLRLMTDHEKSLREELEGLERRYQELHKARPEAVVEEKLADGEGLAELARLGEALADARLRRMNLEAMLQPGAQEASRERARLREETLARLYEQQREKIQLKPAAKAKAIGEDLAEQLALAAIQRAQAMHDSVVMQVKNLKVADQSLAAGRLRVAVSVLEPPVYALPQVFPPPAALLAICALLGLVAGAGLAVLLDRRNPLLRSVGQVQSELGLPVVGRIPVLGVPALVKDESVHRSRQTCLSPDSPGAEAFRGLRTRLIYTGPDGGGRVIGIASPSPADGKSTVAANLACSFAQLGKRVVLIDADFRRGELHRIFDVSGEAGLSSVLAGACPLEAAIAHSPVAPVDVLPCGPRPENPAELLSQAAFDALLTQLRSAYDIVLVDGPPLLADTGAQVLAVKADEVFLCLRAGHSPLGDAAHACELLESLRKRPSGVIVSEAPAERRYGYYSAPSEANGNGHAEPAPVYSVPASRERTFA